jgi:ketosteroid isomerase-like protein
MRARTRRASSTGSADTAAVPQNIEIVRRFYDSFTRRDLESALACADPAIEFDWSASRSPFRDVYQGHDGMERFWAEQEEVFEEFRVEIEEVVELDPERLITVTTVRGRGRGSGVTTEARGAMLWRVRDGAIVSGKLFQEKAEALEAAGLS